MRIRSVKPEFWEDEDVALLPPLTRLTFIGLWNLADDRGYLRYSVVSVAAALYRYESKGKRERAVADAMKRLAETRMVEILECGRHARVPNLPKHQRLAGETRQVHTFEREHLDICEAAQQAASESPPAHPRASPRKARNAPPSRARDMVREGAATQRRGSGVGGAEGEPPPRSVPPRKQPRERSSWFEIEPEEPEYPVAELLGTRFRYHAVSDAQWQRLHEIVDNEFPAGTSKGLDRHAAWRWLADLMGSLSRSDGDPIQAAFDEVNRRIAQRLEAAS